MAGKPKTDTRPERILKPAPRPPKLGNIYAEFEAKKDSIYSARYRVKVQARERFCGGIPKDPEVAAKWAEESVKKMVKTQGWKEDEAKARVAEEMESNPKATDDVAGEMIDEKITRAWCGFRSDDKGIFLEARQLEAMLREGATELELTRDRTKGIRQRLQHGCFVKPPRIYMTDADGVIMTKPTGSDMRVVHAFTPQGKIAAFKRFDVADRACLEFEICIVQGHKLDQDALIRILCLNQEQGLGSSRSQGEGKFDVLEVERLK